MKWELEFSDNERDVLKEATMTEQDLSEVMRSATQEDNEDIVLSPQAQSLIDALNGYIDSVRGAVIAPLKRIRAEVDGKIATAEDLCSRCTDMINKAQRSTSQRIQLLGGSKRR
jgi:hypothetical protein